MTSSKTTSEREIKKEKCILEFTDSRDIHKEECKHLHYYMPNSELIIVTNNNATLPPRTAYFRNKERFKV